MIPLLAFPVINRPDLLARAVATIDHPVDLLLIIDNSETGGMADACEIPQVVRHVFVAEQPHNLGYAASINYTIQTHPELPYWVIANADIALGPGDLAALERVMDDGAMVGRIASDWRCFGLSAECIDTVGFWDLNYHPVFVEDCDYEWRLHLAGIVPVDITDHNTSHIGSVSYTDSGNPNRRFNEKSYPANRAYHIEKWGGDIRGGETYTTPFNRGGSIRDWTLDRRRLAELRWRD